MVSNLDFAQTFLDLAGIDLPDDMQGKSLRPLLEGKDQKDWRESIYYHYYCFPEYHAVRRHDGVRNSRYKLMHFYDINEWELFDLEKDPKEMQSLHDDPKYTKTLQHMKGELAKLRKQYEEPPAPKAEKGRDSLSAMARVRNLRGGPWQRGLDFTLRWEDTKRLATALRIQARRRDIANLQAQGNRGSRW